MASSKGGVTLSLSKRKMKRYVLLIAVLAVLGAGGYYLYPTLPKTLKIADVQGDWDGSNMGTFTNLTPYKVDYTDIKSFSTTASGKNLIVRWELYGKIPKGPVDQWSAIDGDKIDSLNFNLDIDTDNDYTTGPGNGIHEVYLQNVGTGSAKQLETWIKFNGQQNDEDGSVTGGGMGYDYVEASFPLKALGIKKGQRITMRASSSLSTEKKGEFGSVDWVSEPYPLNGDDRYIQVLLAKELVKPVNSMYKYIKYAQ